MSVSIGYHIRKEKFHILTQNDAIITQLPHNLTRSDTTRSLINIYHARNHTQRNDKAHYHINK